MVGPVATTATDDVIVWRVDEAEAAREAQRAANRSKQKTKAEARRKRPT